MPRPHVHLRAAALVGTVAAFTSLIVNSSHQARPLAVAGASNHRSGGRDYSANLPATVEPNLIAAAELGVGITLGGTLIDADHLLVVLTDKLGLARRLIPLHGLEWPVVLLWLARGRRSLYGVPILLVRGWAIGMIVHLAIDVANNPSRLPDLSLLFRALTGRTGQRLPASRGTRWLKEPVWRWL